MISVVMIITRTLILLSVLASTYAALETSKKFDKNSYPSHISLRAGVFHAPPFAMVEKDEYGQVKYKGFQVELLQRLQLFAAQDNVTLEFQLNEVPGFYGEALDLVADDCLEVNNNDTQECSSLDLVVGDYYCNAERAMRVDFTPAWLRTTMSTIKYIDKAETSQDFTTLTQASQAKATVCVPDGTFLMEVVMKKFPDAQYYKCLSVEDCYEKLKAEQCVLFVDDELLLRYRAALDPSLEVTRENFNTQYLVWPMRYELPPVVSQLMKKWMYATVANATLDELYFSYFQKRLCPIGTAGENCELPCDPDHGASDAKGVCVCESTRWTGDDCSIEIPEDTNSIPKSLRLTAYGMLGINAVVIIACASWLYVYRQSAQVIVSQPFFLLLVLLGCLISSCTIIALGQEDSGNGPVHSCMAIPWLYSVGFSVTFGTLFAKILRVYLIFTQNKQQKASGSGGVSTRRNLVTFKETLLVIGAVLLIDVLVLIAWTVIDPLEWRRDVVRTDQFGAVLESEGYCTSDSWQIFGSIIGSLHLGLLGIACYLCYMARDIPTKFSEGKYVSIAMVSNLQIYIVGVPILIILGAEPETSFFVRSVIIWMNDLAVVSLIFGHLMYSVHISPITNTKSTIQDEIGRAVSKYNANASARAKQSTVVLNQLAAGSHISKAMVDSCSESDVAAPLPQNLPKNPATRRSIVSSLSVGSAESCGQFSAVSAKRTKKISWGAAYYSETGEKDDSVVLSLAELSDDSEDEEERSKRHAESGEKRFVSEPIQNAAPKPPDRWRSVAADGEHSHSENSSDSESSQSLLDSETETEEDSLTELPSTFHEDPYSSELQEGGFSTCRPLSGQVQGPPKLPPRLQSSLESIDFDPYAAEGPPKMPARIQSICESTVISEITQCDLYNQPTGEGPPKLPPRIQSICESTECDQCQGPPRLPPRRQSSTESMEWQPKDLFEPHSQEETTKEQHESDDAPSKCERLSIASTTAKRRSIGSFKTLEEDDESAQQPTVTSKRRSIGSFKTLEEDETAKPLKPLRRLSDQQSESSQLPPRPPEPLRTLAPPSSENSCNSDAMASAHKPASNAELLILLPATPEAWDPECAILKPPNPPQPSSQPRQSPHNLLQMLTAPAPPDPASPLDDKDAICKAEEGLICPSQHTQTTTTTWPTPDCVATPDSVY